MLKAFISRLRRTKPANVHPQSQLSSKLAALKENWDGLAKSDSMWAVLSDPLRQNNGWDHDEFYAAGRREITELQDHITDHLGPMGLTPGTESALDFGCGLGRLSQGLAPFYQRVDGVDISSEMVRQARLLNGFGERVSYHLNVANSLPFDDSVFDLVYSNIVLQHIDKANALKYIADFIRVVKPGGAVIFSVPSRNLLSERDVFASAVCGRTGTFTINMNPIPKAEVLDTIQAQGGKLIQVHDYAVAGPEFECFRYLLTK